MDDRGYLTTEHRNPRSTSLDSLSVQDAFDLINGEDATLASAIALARPAICEAIELVVCSFRAGGRLFYVGAGTSGRLGVLDATECPPTFLSPPDMVQGIMAGGKEALTRSVEGAEDSEQDGTAAIERSGAASRDVVFGIATGGTTPFVHGAIKAARRLGAKTIFFACVPREQVSDEADVSIRVLTGPEVVTGSTRMKAGTATKMVLNMVTTIAMVRLGKVFENLMVDVDTATNAKLVERGRRIVQEVTGQSLDSAGELLHAAGGHVKTALVMGMRKVDRGTARAFLEEVDGHVGRLLESGKGMTNDE